MDKITIERETVELAASLIQPLTGKGDREVYDVLRAALAAQPADAQQEPVAIVKSKYGDPERFGEREIRVLADLSKIPYGTKLYAAQPAPAAAIPPGYALVPIDPTPEIIATGAVALMKASDSDLDATKEEIAATYRAMITAAGDKP